MATLYSSIHYQKSYFRYLQKYKSLITYRAMISIGKQLTILPSVDSTNNYAMAQVRAGLAKQGDVFFALEQTAGKGQRGKGWQTQPGTNIILSMVLQPQWLPVSQQFSFSAAIALGCYDFFASHAGDDTKIKWPNDLYWRDRKAGGILIENVLGTSNTAGESEFAGNSLPAHPLGNNAIWGGTPALQWSVVGIGINVNQTVFPEDLPNPVSLKQITGKQWDVIALAKRLCMDIQTRLLQLQENKDLRSDYNNILYKRNEKVRLKKGNRVFDAIIKGVSDSGELLVMTGTEEQFEFGEVQWLVL